MSRKPSRIVQAPEHATDLPRLARDVCFGVADIISVCNAGLGLIKECGDGSGYCFDLGVLCRFEPLIVNAGINRVTMAALGDPLSGMIGAGS